MTKRTIRSEGQRYSLCLKKIYWYPSSFSKSITYNSEDKLVAYGVPRVLNTENKLFSDHIFSTFFKNLSK